VRRGAGKNDSRLEVHFVGPRIPQPQPRRTSRLLNWHRRFLIYTDNWVQLYDYLLFSPTTPHPAAFDRAALDEIAAFGLRTEPARRVVLATAVELMHMESRFQTGPPGQHVEALHGGIRALSEALVGYLDEEVRGLGPAVCRLVRDEKGLAYFERCMVRFVATRRDSMFLFFAATGWAREEKVRLDCERYYFETMEAATAVDKVVRKAELKMQWRQFKAVHVDVVKEFYEKWVEFEARKEAGVGVIKE